MRFHVHPGDEGGCGHYRTIWPAEALRDQGHDVRIFMPEEEDAAIQAQMVMNKGIESVVGLHKVPECDVLVLQRPLRRTLVELIPHLQKAGVAVVVELDDDFTAIHPTNKAWKTAHPKRHPDVNYHHLLRACSLADAVTVSTEALRAKYASVNGVVIPNYVPERYLGVESRFHTQDPIVGWSGSIDTHPRDLQVLGPAIPRLLRARPEVRFGVVGTGVGVARRVGIPETYDLAPTGWVDIQDYPAAMAKLDVGVVPLDPTPFNEAKSWLKGLEYASLGIPFVATPTAAYQQLFVEYGIGALASNPKEWERALIDALDNGPELSRDVRTKVHQNDLTIERRAVEWLQVWQLAAARRFSRV